MFIFNIDRGGTFTDFYVQKVELDQIVEQFCFKVPSQTSQGEGPVVGIKQFLSSHLGQNITKDQKIPTSQIKGINIGTTIATNALLQRKGSKSVLIVNKGFDDILTIRNQARPNIFDLKCSKPSPLATNILSIDSRIFLHQIPAENEKLILVDPGVYFKPPRPSQLDGLIEKIRQINPQSIGVSLCNSYLNPIAENLISERLQELGFKVQKGSQYVDIGYLKRTQTVSLDCFLNPIINKYFDHFVSSFDNCQNMPIRIMKSDGGFTNKNHIKSSQLLLSGPAGGLIGYSKMGNQLKKYFAFEPTTLLGLDMGGTSTDLSKVKNKRIQLNYSFEAEGIQICTPHLQIDTIAAGGGSKLGYFNGMLTVGPESVGSNPGPACYGLGDELAITDANLLLNRLDPDFFPKVFGKNKNEGPNKILSQKAFAKLTQQINKNNERKKSMFEIAEGYIEIGNELMAKSARKILTLGKPDALIVFGSAGGQHCCDVAEKVGISHIIVHRFSGILSAYGLSKAAQSREQKIYLGLQVNENSFDYQQLREVIRKKIQAQKQDASNEGLIVIEQITVGYAGTSYNMKISLQPNLLLKFEEKHKQAYGFSLPDKIFKIQYYVRTTVKQPQVYQSKVQIRQIQSPTLFQFSEAEVFLNGKFQILKKYRIEGMNNCQIKGPALLFSSTSSVLVQSNWIAHVVNETIHLSKIAVQSNPILQLTYKQFGQDKFSYNQCDPIRLTIFATRLMGIAEQMGKVLQKTSISTNIKERLDFSCGIFDWNGHLLANAPHLPVHLGSMQTAVVEQIRRGIKPGDVILSNHPAAGGSHLPDLTVITCFQLYKGMNFYVASRGHHADIGGITPGSMPPFSRKLSEEGVAIQKFELIKNGQFLDKQTRELFRQSRRINDNISDLLAQISANEIGSKLIKILLNQYGVHQFRKYVCFVCENAKQCVENMLITFSQSRNFPSVYTIANTQYMDDGTPLKLQLTINRDKKEAIFDFTGTGHQVISNTNAPKSITKSAILYCLRSLIGKDIPLNSGCLIPIKIIIPQYSILSPSEDAAVVGGNVETSQKLVDLILKPFDFVACSQGTMNNFLFGNKDVSYYQTICGGSGAGNGFEGTTTQCHMTNTRITDPEHLQKYYPVILLAFKKRTNSGGKGKFKGGDGVIRQVMFIEQMQVSILSERRVFRPYGLNGGEDGQTGQNILVKNNGVIWNIGSKNCFLVNKFDKVVINTPSGGGYGKQEGAND